MDIEKIQKVKDSVRNMPDFPIKGIQFKDLTTAFKDPECLKILVDETTKLYKGKGVTKVVGIESRGFICAAAVAVNLNAGFVPIRKPGKLPADTISIDFKKEYGTDTIQIHRDAINENDIVLLHDDLLATGGTMLGALELVQQMKPKKVYVNFICGLTDLGGMDLFPEEVEVTTLFDF